MLWGVVGLGVAGAVFGTGWWFWVDAVICSAVQVAFLHSPNPRDLRVAASLAALMFNRVNKNEIGYDHYSPYGDDSEWRLGSLPWIGLLKGLFGWAVAVGWLSGKTAVTVGK